MHLFYTPDIVSENYILHEEESKHCVRVLRLQKGEMIFLVDGRGGFYQAEITEVHPKQCAVVVKEQEQEYGKRNFKIEFAVAPTKNIERFEWFLEKATEIGIDEITPIICTHSERKEIKTERLEKVLIAAMKQSVRAYLPKLNATIGFKDFIKKEFYGQKFIAHLSEHAEKLQSAYSKRNNVLILIGPEGDFAEEEMIAAKENNFVEVLLGQSRLRTETAAVVACHTINLMNE